MLDFLCYQPSDSYLPKQVPPSYIRILHANSGVRKIDVYGNDRLMAKGLSYRKFTPYFTVPSGQFCINVLHKGTVVKLDIDLKPGDIRTIAFIQDLPLYDMELFEIVDPKVTNNPDMANIRFIHLSSDTADVDISLSDNIILVEKANYKNIPNYNPCKAGKYSLKIKPAEASNTIAALNDIELKPGWNYTLYIIGLTQGKVRLQLLLLMDGTTYIK